MGGNMMCKRCTQNQEIKIKQYANFTPFNEVMTINLLFYNILLVILTECLFY